MRSNKASFVRISLIRCLFLALLNYITVSGKNLNNQNNSFSRHPSLIKSLSNNPRRKSPTSSPLPPPPPPPLHRHQNHKQKMSAFASKSIPPPPPISVPVYSLAAPISSANDYSPPSVVATAKTSMNIMTFCTPVSVAPPKLWTLSLYSNTMTKEYFFQSKIGILQLLDKAQCHLVPTLGKRSGYEVDYSKELECEKNGFKWGSYYSKGNSLNVDNNCENEEEERLVQSMKLLPNCQSYIKVRLLDTFVAGDHEVALCQVLGVGEWNDQDQCVVEVNVDDGPKAKDESIALYSGYLRQKGII